MPPKADKLSQTIENLQLFLAHEAESRQDLSDLARQLTQLNKTLRQKKLTVQIVSSEPALAQGVFDLIQARGEFKRVFQLQFDNIPRLPRQTTPQGTASLKLRQTKAHATGLQQYIELDLQQEYRIGRSPEAEIAINPKLYQGVSWDHAVMSAVPGIISQWQISDRGSTNGTFVNGQRVIDNQLLDSGDIITLACPQTGEMVAELAFTVRVAPPDSAMDREYWEVVDCDLLMVVADSQQSLALEVQEFIANLDQSYLSQAYLLLDTPDPKQEPELAKVGEANLQEIGGWLRELPGWELVPLFLKPFSQSGSKISVDSRQQKKQERFIKTLENLVKRQPENMLAKRIALKVVRAAAPIEPLLEQQQQELRENIERSQQQLAALSQTNLKETSKKALAEANQTKDRFFKQVKLDLAQSKAALLDIYSKRSIVYQIQAYVDGLTPTVISNRDQKVIQLREQLHSDDVNLSLINFCTQSIATWAEQEWHQINYRYCDGGLQTLSAKLHQKLDLVPQLLTESPFTPPDAVDFKENLAISFAGTSCETIYKQKSLGAYIMRQLRSQMMQVMMMLTLVLGFVGIRSSRSQMTQSLSSYFQQYPWLFGIFICGIIFLLVTAYNNENDLNLEEAGVKLKKDLSSYYQGFSKNLLEKVIQDLSFNLELEDKKIADGIEIVSEAYSDRLDEIEQQQLQIKHNLEQEQTQQKKLIDELSELEKLKQI